MFGLPRIPKSILVLLVIVVIVLAYTTLAPVYADFEDGAPSASIRIMIRADDSTTYETSDIGLDSTTKLMTTYPLTTYTADVPPLEPNMFYDISFIVTVTTSGASVSENYTTEVTINGGCSRNHVWVKTTPQVLGPPTYTTVSSGSTSSEDNTHPSKTMQTTNGIPVAFNFSDRPFIFAYSYVDGAKYESWLVGSMVDGSTFDIDIISTSAGGGYGMTTATVNLIVGAGGDLVVEITSIDTVVG